MDSRTFIMLYKAMVRPHIEYANSVVSPYKKGDIEAIEKSSKERNSNITQKVTIQRTFITIKFTYFKYRRLRGDMIEVYKIIHNMYDRSVMYLSSTRGNKYKL